MINHYMGVDPGMVVRAFAIAAATFGATSLFGYVTKRSLSGLGTFFMIATIGIVIALVVNALLIGSTMFSLLLSVITVLLFSLADSALVHGRGFIARVLLRLPFLGVLLAAMVVQPQNMGMIFTVLPIFTCGPISISPFLQTNEVNRPMVT